MPLFAKSSYLTTTDQFIRHWLTTNDKLGNDGPLVLRLDDGSTINLPGLVQRRREMRNALETLQQKIVDEADTAQILNIAGRAILFRVRSFVRAVRSDHATYPELDDLPRVPDLLAERYQFVKSLRSFLAFWARLNQTLAFPLVLAGRYGIREFGRELDNLEDVWGDADMARASRLIAHEERESILAPIPKILAQYQEDFLTIFPNRTPLHASLPLLYAKPGPIPMPVKAYGVWNTEKEMGKISWEGSDEVLLDHYEVRYSPGTVYDPDVESVLATISRVAPKHWLTLEGIRERGRTSLFRVYVILKSGNEAPSDTISITNGVDNE